MIRLPKLEDSVATIFRFRNEEVSRDAGERDWFVTLIEMQRPKARLPYPVSESNHKYEFEVKCQLDSYAELIERFDLMSMLYQQWEFITYAMYIQLFRKIGLLVQMRMTYILSTIQLAIVPRMLVGSPNSLAQVTCKSVKDHVLNALHQAGGVNRCVRGYADGSFSTVLEFNEEETKQWAEHNKVYRFGCSQFINGKCTYRGPHANDKWVKKMERRLVNDSSR